MRISLAVALCLVMSAPALAQQNQAPGDTTSGGGSQIGASSGQAGGQAKAAQAGADTVDSETTGVSGPQKKSSGKATISVPALPSADLCKSVGDDVRDACLATVLNQEPGSGAQ